MDRVFEGTRAKFNATFREKYCPLLTPAQSGFWGATSEESSQCSPKPKPVSPCCWEGRDLAPASVGCSFLLLRPELHPHAGGEAWVPSSHGP